jgi:diguanylate cyclase (GGDEF)-like protein
VVTLVHQIWHGRRWSALAAAGMLALLVLNLPGVGADPAAVRWIWVVTCLLAGVRLAARARGRHRLPWALLGAGVITWAAGALTYTLLAAGGRAVAYPSPADVVWLASYVPLVAAGVVLVRRNVAGRDGELALDGVVAGLVTAALAAAVVLPMVETDHDERLAAAIALAYPVFDMLLLGLAAAGIVLGGRRVTETWRWLAAGLAVLAVGDVVFVFEVAGSADATSAFGGFGDLLWPLAFWLLAGATPSPERPASVPGRARVAPLIPLLASTAGVGVLLADHVAVLPGTAVLLATAALVAAVARTALTLRANVRLQDSAAEAFRDELTGLANRRRLLRDLDLVFAAERGPATLALFDLDGFKAYNDAYGHPAGDGLLASLGHRLRRAVAGHGVAYRLGGDEFCILLCSDEVDHDLVLEQAIAALSQEGEGFSVGASHGRVSLPADAGSGAAALQLADTRMYACKDAGRASTRRQSRDLLLQLLREQQPELEEHSGDVGELVTVVGARLGLDRHALDHAEHAAELHDVGKVAIPAAILDKPGPLDEDEWALMKRHTIIGERILSAVPALVPVGRIVRATHERWDGDGYPDGLRGAEIPLGARIIAVCDTFHAITTDRPYRAGRPAEAALAELRRCAGTQFDPGVVEAFAAELAAGTITTHTAAPQTSEREGGVARRVAPAGAIAQSAAGELAQLAKLRGLLHATRLARGGADVADVLDAIARTIATSLGFRVVSINVFRPEWNDFFCTAVHGADSVRAHLLGRAEPAESWRPLLAEQFARDGAYFVPAGAVEFDDDVAYHVPEITPTDDPGAWQPDDMLLIPLRSTRGDMLGMVSVDEPVWGRRPSDSEIEVLVAVAEHAALAVQSARSSAIARAAHRAGDRVARLGGELAGALDAEDVRAAVETCVREAVGFGTVGVDLVRTPDDARTLEALIEHGRRREGCVLLSREQAVPARAWRGTAASARNGRGEHAWNEHLLAVPVRGADCELLAVIWADDPVDRLLPHVSTLSVLRTIAAHAIVPLAWGRRAPAPARETAG